jgi:hypothetical protein
MKGLEEQVKGEMDAARPVHPDIQRAITGFPAG